MSARVRFTILLGIALALASPAAAQNGGGLPGTEHAQARQAYEQAERVVLLSDQAGREVVHYRFDLRVGPGPFDVIAIHRVVKEASPGRPAKRMEGVLLLPGLPQLFEGIFLQAPLPSHPAGQSSTAVYLALHDIDVWGMDYGHSFVPYPSTAFDGFAGWGVERDAADVQTTLSTARWLRVTSEQGNGPIHLLGFSYGGILAYAAASEDTQRPGNLRNIKGLIPVDGTGVKVPLASTEQLNACNNARATLASQGAGVYHVDSSVTMLRGLAALNDPDGLSPISGAVSGTFPAFPAYTFTNYQASQVSPVRTKFLGGTYTVSPPSVTLFFTAPLRWFRLQSMTPPYYPNGVSYEIAASRCDSDLYPVAFDDHLSEIQSPIFSVSRQESAAYSATLTASTDVTTLVVNPTLDSSLYGHADFFLADNAATEIWRYILTWIQARR